MLATSKISYFQVTTLLLMTTGTDDPSLIGGRAILQMSGHQYRVVSMWL